MKEQSSQPSPARQRRSLVTAGFGQSLVLTFVNTFLLIYLVEYAKISSAGMAKITLVMTAARVFDALNDPVMGGIIDKTRTRYGKMRPYILISAVPVALLSTLLFSIPSGASETFKIIMFAVVYLLWGIFYTVCDVPYWSLVGAVFSEPEERNLTIAHTRAIMAVATGLITLSAPWMAAALSFSESCTAAGWGRTAVLLSFAGMLLFTLAFFGTRERCDMAHEESVSLARLLSTLFHNKPLFMVLLGSILGFGRLLIQTGGAVFSVIAYRDEKYFTFIGAAIIAGLILSSLLTPLALRSMSGKKLIIASSLTGAVFNIAMYIGGFANIPLMMAMIFGSGMTLGVFMVVQTTMIADAVDFIERRTGVRNDGISFSSLTFVSKMMGSLAVLVFGFVLSSSGYESGITVTQAMQDSVFRSVTLLPAASCLASAIPFAFYRLDG